MNISSITKVLWENSAEIQFGSELEWSEESFKKKWVDLKNPGLWCNKEGFYWISTNAGQAQLTELSRPETLPSSGRDFGELATKNSELLHGNLCSDHGSSVIYNGHRSHVMSRLRSHFSISDGTGALGIQKYDLSQYDWSAFVFHIEMVNEIKSINEEEKNYIRKIMREETGRCAIESAWRTLYGWPVLCKK